MCVNAKANVGWVSKDAAAALPVLLVLSLTTAAKATIGSVIAVAISVSVSTNCCDIKPVSFCCSTCAGVGSEFSTPVHNLVYLPFHTPWLQWLSRKSVVQLDSAVALRSYHASHSNEGEWARHFNRCSYTHCTCLWHQCMYSSRMLRR